MHREEEPEVAGGESIGVGADQGEVYGEASEVSWPESSGGFRKQAMNMRKNIEVGPLRLRDIKVSGRDQLMIDPKLVAIEKGHNPRNYSLPENRAHLDELKASIREVGIKVPLLVRWDAAARQCVLVDGECRLRAVLELIKDEGLEILAVPTVQVPGDNEAERLITSLTANMGKPLSKWEIGIAFQRFTGWGWDVGRIARRMGYTERYVKESIELSDAPEDVKQLLSQQAVTPSLALQHIRVDGAAAGEGLRGKVERARANAASKEKANPARSGKGRRGRPRKENKVVTATREKKSNRISFEKKEVEVIKEALKMGREQPDAGCARVCGEALAIVTDALAFV